MDQNTSSYRICLVIPAGKTTSSVSKRLKETYDQLGTHEMNPEWIESTECLDLKLNVNGLFICDVFQGEAYNHLLKLGCRILGPLCLLTCFKDGTNLPKRPRPILSLNMRHVVVTFSNIPPANKKKLKEMVLLMGGECPNSLTQSCTHLVTGCVGSEKYVTAVRLKLPIVTPDWITSCWTEIQEDVLEVRHCTDSFYDTFKCKAFYGLVVTASQLDTKERHRIQALVTENGGRYSGAMKMQETTHLVLETPNGNKFDYACSWNVKCVTKDWVFDCAAAGTYLPEEPYELRPDGNVRQNKASTPKKEERPLPSANCSILLPGDTMDCVNETCLSNVSFIVAPAKSAQSRSRKVCQSAYLENCKIFLCALDNKYEHELEAQIRSAGGTVCRQVDNNTSHIICTSLSALPKISAKVRSNVLIVSPEWINSCVKAQCRLPEENYILAAKKSKLKRIDLSSLSDKVHKDSVQMASDTSNQMEEADSSKTCLSETSARKFSESTTDLEDKENRMMQSKTSFSEFRKPSDICVTDKPSTCETKDPNGSLKDGTTEMASIFSDIDFVVVDHNPEDQNLLVDMLESGGGTVHSIEKSVPDNCVWIVPVIEFGQSLAPGNATVRTNFWVHMCIEQQAIQPVNTNRLFKPILISSSDDKPLKGCVLAFSQFNSSEKKCLMYLANTLGAECSEYFVRVDNKKKGLLANTHLILAAAEGTKYDAANKWRIPAVHKEWLFYAAEENNRPDEKLFSIDKPVPQIEPNRNSFVPDGQSNMSMDVTDIEIVPVEPASSKLGVRKDSTNYSRNQSSINTNDISMKSGPSALVQNDDSNNISVKPVSSVLDQNDDSSDWKPEFDVSEALEMLKSKSTYATVGNKKKRSMSLEETANYHFSIARRNFGIDSPVSHANTSSLFAKPLAGVVLCVARKLASQQKRFHSITEKLGGRVLWSYDDTCTHLVYQGKLTDHTVTKDVRQAQAKSKFIISPEWLLACEETLSRLNESDFPCNYNPRLSLSGQFTFEKVHNISLKTSPCRRNSKSTEESVFINLEKQSPVKCQMESPVKCHVQSPTYKTPPRTSSMTSSIAKQNENLNKSLSMDPSKRMDVNKQLQELMTVRKNSLTVSNQRHNSESSRFHIEQLKHVPLTNTEPETQSSQNIPIMWEDPTEKNEKERLAKNPPAPLRDTEPPNIMETQEDDDIQVMQTQRVPQKRVFLLSGLNEANRIKCSRIIEDLGGEVTNSYSIEVTHLVCEQPSKNEKILSSLAAGVWILHPRFLQASEEASGFVSEEDFEWGSEAMRSTMQNMPSKLQMIAMAPHTWRTRISSTGKKAFHNWEVKLFVPEQKLSAFTCILKAGGAKIVENFSPGFTYNKFAFLEGQFDVDVTELVAQGVTCVKPEYFSVFLVECRTPNCSLFTVKESHSLSDSSNKRRLQSFKTVSKKNRST